MSLLGRQLNLLPRCSATGKIQYATEREARYYLELIQDWFYRLPKQKRRREAPPCRSYRCPDCDKWHHTGIAAWNEAV